VDWYTHCFLSWVILSISMRACQNNKHVPTVRFRRARLILQLLQYFIYYLGHLTTECKWWWWWWRVINCHQLVGILLGYLCCMCIDLEPIDYYLFNMAIDEAIERINVFDSWWWSSSLERTQRIQQIKDALVARLGPYDFKYKFFLMDSIWLDWL